MEWINKIINIFWELSNVLLIGILLVLVTFLMSLIFKKKMTLLAAMMVIILGSIFVIDRLQYTTFQELVSEELNEESIVRSITIRKNGLVENNQKTSRVTIVDEETLQQILDDFSEVKLKRDRDARQLLKDYNISILTTNKIEDDHFLTANLTMDMDSNYIKDYRIVSETDHLETIKSLFENDKVIE